MTSRSRSIFNRFAAELAVAAMPACGDDERRRLVERALERLAEPVAAMEALVFEEPLPVEEDGLERLDEECHRLLLWLAEARRLAAAPWLAHSVPGGPGFGGQWSASQGRAAASERLASLARDDWRAFAAVEGRFAAIDTLEMRLASLAITIDEAIRGLALWREGERLESSGEHFAAFQAYRAVLAHHPDLGAALIAAERSFARWRRETRDRAQIAMARAEWARAIELLERLLAHAAGEDDTRTRLETARRELARTSLRAAESLESRGLLGYALVRYVDALHAVPSAEEVSAALARLEDRLGERIRPRFSLRTPELDGRELLLRQQLWRVSRESCRKLGEWIEDAFLRTEEIPPSRPDMHTEEFVLEEIDFAVYERAAMRGSETRSLLRSFDLARNPRLERAATDLRRARDEWLRLKTAYETAPGYLSAQQRDLVELALGGLEQARRKHEALSEEIPSLVWEDREIPVESFALVAELAARCRASALGFADEWVSVRWEMTDRVVEDRGSPRYLRDPLEVPTRDEILRLLARRLGRRIRQRVAAGLEERLAALYHGGVERIAEGRVDSAIDLLATYAFALRESASTLQLEDALRRLDELTGGSAFSRWIREGRETTGPATTGAAETATTGPAEDG